LPSHVSMLTGVVPNKHGVFWNDDLPLTEPVYPKFPTLFEVAHAAGLSTALVSGKGKFKELAKPGSVDWPRITDSKDDSAVTDDPSSRHIPGMLTGHGIRRNSDLTLAGPKVDINTEDTFATTCWLLGLRPLKPNIDGKPVRQVLDKPELLQADSAQNAR